MEVKKCEKTSDRICKCIPGYMPDVRYALGSGKLGMYETDFLPPLQMLLFLVQKLSLFV